MQPWRNPLWPHDSNNQASGKPGEVQTKEMMKLRGLLEKSSDAVSMPLKYSPKVPGENSLVRPSCP